MDRWVGKIAVVTGASSGVGEAITKSFADNGIIVVGLARRHDKIKEYAAKLKGTIHGVHCDLTKEEDILKAFRWVEDNLGGVDILVNNAGMFKIGNLSDGLTVDWKNVLNINILALSICTREALKTMRKRGDNGHIIHINSTTGHYISNMKGGVYPASKFAVTALTESLRLELGDLRSKIKITSISPGLINTDMAKNAYIESGYISPNSSVRLPNSLDAQDIADAAIYVIGTKPHVQEYATISKGTIYAKKCDITKENEIIETFNWIERELGGVDILINNAGIVKSNSLSTGNTELWRKVLDTNVMGLSVCTKEALKTMRIRGDDGHIIHINSVAGHIVPQYLNVFMGMYSASKFAVTALTESLRIELQSLKSNIKISSISPSTTATELIDNFVAEASIKSTEIIDHSAPILEVLQVKDVVDAIVYVLSTRRRVQVHELIIQGLGHRIA